MRGWFSRVERGERGEGRYAPSPHFFVFFAPFVFFVLKINPAPCGGGIWEVGALEVGSFIKHSPNLLISSLPEAEATCSSCAFRESVQVCKFVNGQYPVPSASVRGGTDTGC